MIRQILIAIGLVWCATPVLAQQVEFTQVASSVSGEELHLSTREQQRIERFLSHVFPMKPMRRLEHVSGKPISRRAAYSIISQEGMKFILVGYSAKWDNLVNVLAIYRMEDGGPNQVWRSKPWEGSYYALHFQTAKVGARNVVLFQEGGSDDEFGLASIFSFQNTPKGLIVHDLTPSIPWLRAQTHFPLRPLYGQGVAMRMENDNLLLTASDQAYTVFNSIMRPTRTWKYNSRRGHFERIKEEKVPAAITRMTNIGMRSLLGK